MRPPGRCVLACVHAQALRALTSEFDNLLQQMAGDLPTPTERKVFLVPAAHGGHMEGRDHDSEKLITTVSKHFLPFLEYYHADVSRSVVSSRICFCVPIQGCRCGPT